MAGAGGGPGRGADAAFFVLPLAGPEVEPLRYAAPVTVSFRAPGGAAARVRFRVGRGGGSGGELREYAGPFVLGEAGVLRVEAVEEDAASGEVLDRLVGYYRLTRELAGTAVDGYVRGCEVGAAPALDWSLKSFDFSSITDFRGHFRFDSDLREGWLALRPGELCVDLATELPVRVGMISVVGAGVISPFTTVGAALLEDEGAVSGGDRGRVRREEAAVCLQRAFRVPEGYDAFAHDPLKEPEARRGEVMSALNQLQNFLVASSSLWAEGGDDRGGEEALAALSRSLGAQARVSCTASSPPPPALDLTSPAVTEILLQRSGAPGAPWLLAGVAAYIAKMNTVGADIHQLEAEAAVLHSSRVAEAAQGQLLDELRVVVQSGDAAKLSTFLVSVEESLKMFLQEKIESDRRTQGELPAAGSERTREEPEVPTEGLAGSAGVSVEAPKGLVAAAAVMAVFLVAVVGLWRRRGRRRAQSTTRKARSAGAGIVLTDLASSIRIMEGKQPVSAVQKARRANPLLKPTPLRPSSRAYEKLVEGGGALQEAGNGPKTSPPGSNSHV